MKNFSSLSDTCRTYHSFKADSVKEIDILEALENSLKAPNHKFTFPWKYIWVKGVQKQQLADLYLETKSKGESLSERQKDAIKKKVLNPELLVFCQKISKEERRRKEDYATMSCSVQLFALSLAEKGIGYKWSTGKVTRHSKTYEILKLDPNQFEIIGFIFAGMPMGQIKDRLRPQLSEVLSRSDKM